MNKPMQWVLGVAIVAVTGAAVYSYWSSSQQFPELPQTNPPAAAAGAGSEGGTAGAKPLIAEDGQNNVSIAVEFANTIADQPRGDLVFVFELNNHMIDLSNLGLDTKATLTPEPGQPVTKGFNWKEEASGHHASGTLTLKNVGADGKPVVTAGTTKLTLTLRDVAGAPVRTFTFSNAGGWHVPQQ